MAMYKHAISWPASFVDRPVRNIRPQLQVARAIAKRFGLNLVNDRQHGKKFRPETSHLCSTNNKSAVRRKSVGSQVKDVADGKLQAELARYLSAVNAQQC